jgi:hypothetical protein
MEIKEAQIVDGLPFILPPHLAAIFEKTEIELRDAYGISPGVTDLVRLWLACACPWRIREEFERAVLGIKQQTIHPNQEGNYDDDCL